MNLKQNSIKNLGLKYLNIVFSILMLVVFSLNIDQIVHKKRISKAEHLYDVLNYSNDLKPIIIDQCKTCKNHAYVIMSNLNSKILFLLIH